LALLVGRRCCAALNHGLLLMPLVSWATPAHMPEGYLLKGSIRQMLAAPELAAGYRGRRLGVNGGRNFFHFCMFSPSPMGVEGGSRKGIRIRIALFLLKRANPNTAL
jgi:hypothetical protein